MPKYSPINSPRLNELRKNRRKASRKKTLFFVILFFIIIVSFSFVLRINKLKINNVVVTGNKIVETNQIIEIINQKIAGNYLWVFPKNNFLIYPKRQIKNALNNNLKRLSAISISIDNLKTLNIDVKEYEGKYLWCGILINLTLKNDIKNKCYFLNSNGYAFDEAPYFSGDIYFKFYGNKFENELKDNNPIGSNFLNDKFLKLIKFREDLEKMGLQPSAFYLDENNEGNIAISNKLSGPKIIFKIDDNYEKIAENLQSAITTQPLQTELKTKLDTLLYLDLRFGNKIYYKFQ